MEDQRLIDLEIKISYQAIAIEELQKVVFQSHRTIETLEKSVKVLTERFVASPPSGADIGPGNEKPPHY